MLSQARCLIEARIAPLLRCSRIYESAPWGMAHQADFLNQALELSSAQTPMQLLDNCLEIEISMGRKRGARYAARSIDIDLLYYDSEVVTLSQLTLPHPEIERRRFTLIAMSELAPNWVHPILQKTQLYLLRACLDPLDVHLYQPQKVVPHRASS